MPETTKTAKSAIIYAVGVAINKLASFIMLPIYTRFLSPADYGTIELLVMTIDIVGFIVGVGLAESIFRFYFKYDDQASRRKVLTTSFILICLFYFLAATAGYFSSDSLAALVLEGRPQDSKAFKLIFAIFLLDPFQTVPMIFIRAQQKAKLFVIIATLRLVLQLSLNIYFIVFLNMGIFGILTSTLITVAVSGVLLSTYMIRLNGLGFGYGMAVQLLLYGAPLIISNLGNFIITFSDRYFLKAYANLSAVGVYSLGYKLGFLLSAIAVAPVFATWAPKRFEIAKTPTFQETNARVFFIFTLFISLTALSIAILSRDLFRIMSAPEFIEAYKIVPFIMLAYIFQAWGTFTNFGIYYSGNTRFMAYIGIISATVILALSFLLIPAYGPYGAATATLVTFFFRFLLTYVFAQRFYALDLPWGKASCIVGAACLIYSLSRTIELDNIVLSILVNSGLVIVFIGGLFISPLFHHADRSFVLKICRNPVKTMKTLRSG